MKKNNIKSKALSLMLSIIMVLGVFVQPTYAQESVEQPVGITENVVSEKETNQESAKTVDEGQDVAKDSSKELEVKAEITKTDITPNSEEKKPEQQVPEQTPEVKAEQKEKSPEETSETKGDLIWNSKKKICPKDNTCPNPDPNPNPKPDPKPEPKPEPNKPEPSNPPTVIIEKIIPGNGGTTNNNNNSSNPNIINNNNNYNNITIKNIIDGVLGKDKTDKECDSKTNSKTVKEDKPSTDKGKTADTNTCTKQKKSSVRKGTATYYKAPKAKNPCPDSYVVSKANSGENPCELVLKKLDKIDGTVTGIDEKVNKIDKTVDENSKKLDSISEELAALKAQNEELLKASRTNDDLNTIKWLLIIGLILLGLILLTLLFNLFRGCGCRFERYYDKKFYSVREPNFVGGYGIPVSQAVKDSEDIDEETEEQEEINEEAKAENKEDTIAEDNSNNNENRVRRESSQEGKNETDNK